MSIKSSQVILASIPLIVALAIPAFAQSSTGLTAQKGGVNAVELGSKQQCSAHGGQCGAHGGPGGERHSAWGGRGGKGGHQIAFRHHHGTFSSLKGEYALSNDQLQKLYSIKNQSREEAQPKVADLISTMRKMRDLLSEPNVDKSQVMGLENQINGDKAALGNIRVESKLNQLSVLTDQQRQELRREFVKRSVEFGKG